MIFKNSRAFAQQCDKKDPLSSFRKEFLLPTDTQGNELIYLCGNSLGLQPLKTKDYIQQELDDWGKHGVEGHTDAKNLGFPIMSF